MIVSVRVCRWLATGSCEGQRQLCQREFLSHQSQARGQMPLPAEPSLFFFFKYECGSCIIWDILLLQSTRWTSEVTISLDFKIFIANYNPAGEGSLPLSSLLSLQPPRHSADKAKCLDGWLPPFLPSFTQPTHLL